MIWPIIGARLHGWLDDLVVLIYAAAAFAPIHRTAMLITVGGAFVHLVLTRITDYPQGAYRLISFRTHAYVELCEGIAVAGAAWMFTAGPERIFLLLMGLSQLGAFSFSDYTTDKVSAPT